ncbi:dienelactone hydrolase family protein [Vibrio kasasachensis]|uniref:alpha/beta hydrolase n=1 Tax=Vibrio kasasachensis TaxID=2910248 RepID=UPI003D108C60
MKWKISAAIILTTLLAVFLLIPDVQMPKPDGKHQVGATQFEIRGENNWVQVMAWYPAESIRDAKHLSYMPEWLGKATASQTGLPEILFGDDGISSSYIDIPIVTGQHPVLIYNHGYGSSPRQNMTQFEQLASHGYIVLSIGHPGDSLALKTLAGDLVYQLQQAQFQFDDDAVIQQVEIMTQALNRASEATSRAQWHEVMGKIESSKFNQTSIARFPYWYANNTLLLDNLNKIQSGELTTQLKSGMDLNNIGAFGHSFGGAISVELALKRAEIKAAMNLDGPQFQLDKQQAFNKPVCFVYGDMAEGLFASHSKLNDALLEDSNSNHCSFTFKGANHNNFTDVNYFTPMKYFGYIGEINNQEMGKQLNNLIMGYFDWQLLGAKPLQPNSNIIQVNKVQG